MNLDQLKKIFAQRKNTNAFSAKKKADNELEIMLYGEIGQDFWGMGIGAKDVADQLKAAGDISSIALRINSPGGDVFEGAAIFNLLAGQSVPVNVIIDGLAASAASYIAMVGKTVTMGEGAMYMIHNPWSFAIGDANDMRAQANILDKVRDSMLSGYMRRFSGTKEELLASLDAETWMTAEEAKAAGFCESITSADDETNAKAAAVSASFDLTLFKNTPEKLKAKIETEKPRAENNDTDGAITEVESAPTTPAENGTDCTCPCESCQNSNCTGCTTADCNYDNCDCASKDAKSPATNAATEADVIAMEHEHRKRRLRLMEIV
jgi:ATP-dependent Clp protease protease subunit